MDINIGSRCGVGSIDHGTLQSKGICRLHCATGSMMYGWQTCMKRCASASENSVSIIANSGSSKLNRTCTPTGQALSDARCTAAEDASMHVSRCVFCLQ